ncbi:hypothetical protein BASA83_003308 [Batrachochytrium salamandrivorans]|nr:hypothetical protein BASA83_003308 [Batrachochytrium salamandrivorans]
MRISIATVCSVAIFALPSVTAWGVVAHRVIGLIAKEFLTKEGLEYVDAYLHQQSMDSIGSWADDERESSRGSDAPEYHFTDSMDPSGTQCVYDDHRDCANGICLSSAIARHNKILMESTSPDDPGAEDSMKYIIHYVSDVCQPLHTDGREKGGSLTKVRFGGKRWTLHRIWDTGIPEKRVRVDFQNNPVLYANYLIRSIKTGENKVPSESWTSNTPIDAVNDIGNSMVAIDYTADSYELSCSVIWPEYKEHHENSLSGQYYSDVIKTLDMQISKAGLRVANWLNQLARLHSQTKVEAATLPAAQPGKSNIEKHPPSPRESMPQSKKGPSMSSKKLVSGAQKPDDPPPSNSDHDDHQVADDDAAEWQVVKKKGPRSSTATTKGKGGNLPKGKGATCQNNGVFTLNVQGRLVRSQRWFWYRRTKQLYRNRYWLTPQVRPKTVKQRHSFALMETLRICGDSASLQKYVTRQLLDTSGFFKDPSFDQSRAHGTRYLMLARMDALWTARKAIQIGILVNTHPFSVDHCILCDQQLLSTSIAHLVVDCEQVTGHRIQSGLVPAIQKSRLRLLGRALDPGVENVYIWLRGGVINGRSRSRPALVGRECGA